MLGVLAQEWSGHPDSYQDAIVYNYSASAPTLQINTMWANMYNAIANVNVILEMIDDKQNIFSNVNYRIIKGEALALRAFIHFDLVRLFGASYAQNSNMPAIPYVEKYSTKETIQFTVKQAVERVLVDLNAAAELLKIDPIYTGNEITEQLDNGYLMNRTLQLNYYAVKGLQARVHLWKGDHTNAALCAREVINSGKFTWNTENRMSSSADFTGSTEHLWCIDVNNLSTFMERYFNEQGVTNTFSINSATRTKYYNATGDYRYLYLFAQNPENVSVHYSKKFHTSTGGIATNNKMAMIKLAEMYFILAECEHAAGGDPLPTLEIINTARGGVIQLDPEDFDFQKTLIVEFRKEFLGEGQLWFLYKRLNMVSFDRFAQLNHSLEQLQAYIFPLPDAEYESASRQPNRIIPNF
jgi:hypothetical protein